MMMITLEQKHHKRYDYELLSFPDFCVVHFSQANVSVKIEPQKESIKYSITL